MTDKPTCGDAGGLTKAGAPCRSTLNLGDGGRCLMHDTSRAEERLRVTQAGGVASAVAKRDRKTADPDDVPTAPRTLQDAVTWSSWAIHGVACGRIG